MMAVVVEVVEREAHYHGSKASGAIVICQSHPTARQNANVNAVPNWKSSVFE